MKSFLTMCPYLFLYPAYHAACDPAYLVFMNLAKNKISRIASGMIGRIITNHLFGVNTPKTGRKTVTCLKKLSYQKSKVFDSPGLTPFLTPFFRNSFCIYWVFSPIYYFAKLFGANLELAVHLDREPDAKNTDVVDTIMAEAVVEAACKKMSHPVEDLQNHQEIHALSKRAIMHCLAQTSGDMELTLSVPQAKGHGRGCSCDVNFVYDMAAFILANK